MALNQSSIYNRCFIFSKTQLDQMIQIKKGTSAAKPKLGRVIVNGVPKQYTDKVVSMDRVPFSDAVLVYQGDIRSTEWTDPEW